MLNLFRKKNIPVSAEEIFFFKTVFSVFPPKYSYLMAQIESNMLLYKVKNEFNPLGFTLAIDEIKRERFIDYSQPNFILLKGIFIKQKLSNLECELEVGLSEGVFNYYALPCSFRDLDVSHVRIEFLHEKKFAEQPTEDLISLIGSQHFELILKKFKPLNIYKTEFDGNEYLVFSTDDEGNIFCVDNNRKYYFITHDPFKQISIDIT